MNYLRQNKNKILYWAAVTFCVSFLLLIIAIPFTDKKTFISITYFYTYIVFSIISFLSFLFETEHRPLLLRIDAVEYLNLHDTTHKK